ncbi:MAG: LPXTG cell wall anchor domain-containing protein, partial [Dehalococcoidia bacterium]
CHGNPQTSGLEFFIDGPVADSGPTDGAGDVTFGALPAGTYEISGGVPGEFADTFVYCSINEDPNNVIPVTGTAIGVSIDVAEGAAVICDWYNIPIDLSGNGDGDDDDDTATTLPNTGAGVSSGERSSAIYLGGATVMALAGLAFVARRRAIQL